MKLKAFLKKYNEIILYVAFGIVCAVCNWAVYILMNKLLNVDLSAVSTNDNAIFDLLKGDSGSNLKMLCVSTLCAWFVNVIVAFVTNKIWVFRSHIWTFKVVAKEFFVFFYSHIFTGVIEWFGTPLLVMVGLNQQVLGIEGAVAKFIISLVVLVLNFVFSKLMVFKKDKIIEVEDNSDVKNQGTVC